MLNPLGPRGFIPGKDLEGSLQVHQARIVGDTARGALQSIEASGQFERLGTHVEVLAVEDLLSGLG